MIHEHTRRNFLISFIRHAKILNIGDKRLIDINLAGISQHHRGSRYIHFADRADAEHRVFRNGSVGRFIADTRAVG
ncbi:hypothetical protein D3C87_2121320 [compost metagenome]